MPPINVNAGRNRRGRPRNVLADNVTANARPRGRFSEDARIIGSATATWDHLRDTIGAFYREDNICRYNGCSSEMALTYRAQKQQFYYHCRFSTPLYAHRDRQVTITSNTVFYNSKKTVNIVYCILLEYFRSAKANDIFSTIKVHGVTIAQISKDCQAMMNSDYVRYHEDGSVVPADYSGFYFRRHQVVNHSINFATEDQVQGNQTEGLIHTNVIEGLWTPIKRFIHPRNRTIKDCPGKLLEFMWRRENQGLGLKTGMERCIREVQLVNTPNSGGVSPDLITRAQAWDEEQVEVEEAQPFQHEDDYDSEVETDYDTDDEDWVPEEGSNNPDEGLTLASSFQPSSVSDSTLDIPVNEEQNLTTTTIPTRHNTRRSRSRR
ncbi:hypothetical protein INT48_001335 [Thamnidium elegans]|uniref:Uncharacterized protein n=1 Tax=Thamnidium elegans TaxID=101142 RepID=A0A8H7SI28_9FUNG|nr:hypothetical protein INT48_001335 [Thamnidium elegans]